jgi:hypothetical protein
MSAAVVFRSPAGDITGTSDGAPAGVQHAPHNLNTRPGAGHGEIKHRHRLLAWWLCGIVADVGTVGLAVGLKVSKSAGASGPALQVAATSVVVLLQDGTLAHVTATVGCSLRSDLAAAADVASAQPVRIFARSAMAHNVGAFYHACMGVYCRSVRWK